MNVFTEKYDVVISVKGDIPPAWDKVSIAPLRRDTFVALDQKTIFEKMDILQLTEFYRIRVKGLETEVTRVIMIPTAGIPEDRESAVVRKHRKSNFERSEGLPESYC